MVNYARMTRKAAPLHTDFAREFVARHYGADAAAVIYELLPTFTRGPRNGLVKGHVNWEKVERGGWVRTGPGEGNGHVARPGTRNVKITVDKDWYGHADVRGLMTRGTFAEMTDVAWMTRVREIATELFAAPPKRRW